MSEKTKPGKTEAKSVKAAVYKFSAGLEKARSRRVGSILLRLTGDNGGDFYLHATSNSCSVSREPAMGTPHVEVIGSADRISAILNGTKEGRLQFYAGGIRVRGDLQYLSELAYELGFIKEPF